MVMLTYSMLFKNTDNVHNGKESDAKSFFTAARNDYVDICTLLKENNTVVNEK